MKDLDNYDWYCDECNAYLNDQEGFNTYEGTWTCTECGYENYINEYNIVDDDNYNEEDYDEYNNDYSDDEEDDDKEDDDDDSEGISVSDAALIWASHGKDEDYMFGYSEEELEDALY